MFFVRLEHNVYRHGPYNHIGCLVDMNDACGFDFMMHPGPNQDGCKKSNLTATIYKYKFGFKDWQSCKWWWNRGSSGLQVAKEYEFVFSVYEVEKRIDLPHQSLVLAKQLKTPLEEICPTQLPEMED